MKKLTAGVLTVMLGLVATGANAEIASKAYVEQQVGGVSEKIGNVTMGTTASTVTGAIKELKDGMLTSGSVDASISTAITDGLDAEKDGAIAAAIATAVAGATDANSALGQRVKGLEDTGVTAAKISAIDTNTTAIESLKTDKQNTLTDGENGNIKGTNGIQVSIEDGIITVDGSGTAYTLDAATESKLGGVKSGGAIAVDGNGGVTLNAATATMMGGVKSSEDVSVNAETGVITVNKATAATSATQDGEGHTITEFYIPKPSGSCTDCVLTFNGTDFSWEEIDRGAAQN